MSRQRGDLWFFVHFGLLQKRKDVRWDKAHPLHGDRWVRLPLVLIVRVS